MKSVLQLLIVQALVMITTVLPAQFTGGIGRGDSFSEKSNSNLGNNFVQSGFWSETANWSANKLPDEKEMVYLMADCYVDGAATVSTLINTPGASLTIKPSGRLTVSGFLDNQGTLTIESDASGTGSLIHNTPNITAAVNRYIEAWSSANHGWHLMSSPLANQAISTEFVNIFAVPISSGVDLYKWYEPLVLWINIKNSFGSYNWGIAQQNWSSSYNPVFETGKGYLIAYAADQNKTFTGILNISDVAVTNLTNNLYQDQKGWHLLGNPFSSAIKFNQGNWNKVNIGAYAQVWDETAASYKIISGDEVIPPHNGFMVYTSGNGSLTIPADARLHSDSNWYKSVNENRHIVLKANDPDGKTSQETIITFHPDATLGFDLNFDSYFLTGFAPMFYSISNNKLLALNALPECNKELVIPLGFVKNNSANFNITLEQNTTEQTLWLVDMKNNSEHNLSLENYAFISALDDDPNRFLLKFESNEESVNNAPPSAYVYQNTLYLPDNSGPTKVEVFDLIGRCVLTSEITGDGLQSMPLSLRGGIYIFRITGNGNTTTLKALLP
ncbi:MAG: T9SS type A sorting domain-containing protein [Bacteroidales bacterium]|nr:T9SS type A sorting domain-containing protein [Bacteroidales bacterium]